MCSFFFAASANTYCFVPPHAFENHSDNTGLNVKVTLIAALVNRYHYFYALIPLCSSSTAYSHFHMAESGFQLANFACHSRAAPHPPSSKTFGPLLEELPCRESEVSSCGAL